MGKYDEVLKPFTALMERELHANSGKGDRPGWLQMDRKTALLEIFYHLAKLQKATKDNDLDGVREYAADVANMSMMLVDVCGALPAAEQPAAQSLSADDVSRRFKAFCDDRAGRFDDRSGEVDEAAAFRAALESFAKDIEQPATQDSDVERALTHLHVLVTSSHNPGWKANREAWGVIWNALRRSRPAEPAAVPDECVGRLVELTASIISGAPFPSARSLAKAREIVDVILAAMEGQ